MPRPVLCLLLFITFWPTSFTLLINPYPKVRDASPDGPCGDPLFLTSYIKSNRLKKGREAAVVQPLLGDVQSYAGFFTVDDAYNSNMYMWFFPAENNTEKAPLALWLQGGPGASSIYGTLTENGPYVINEDLSLKMRDYYWSQELNVLYIDNPVGAGFSFTDSDDGYARNEEDVAKNLYEALIQFFQLFPMYQSNDFYVTGESYAGKYIPAIAYAIHAKNPSASLKINLKGIAIGDGLSDPENMMKYGDYLYQIGLIDVEARKEFHIREKRIVHNIRNEKYIEAFHGFDELLNGDLTKYPTLFHNKTGFINYFNFLYKDYIFSPGDMDTYLKKHKVRKAIHAGNLTFADGNKVEIYLKHDIMKSVKSWLEVLMDNYRVLLYNGQLDIICAYPLTINYVRKLKWKGDKMYKKATRKQWLVNNDIAGYSKTVGNFTELLVRNAGHCVPSDQSLWSLDLITRFTNGIPF